MANGLVSSTRWGRLVLATTAIGLAIGSVASAEGFRRGVANTDVLYEPGNFVFSSGLTYINPNRGFDSIDGQSGDFGDYTQNYTIPSMAIGFGGENFACAGTYIEPFAAEADYTGSPGGALPFQVSSTQSSDNADRIPGLNPTASSLSRTQGIEFKSNEFGLTCRASYTADYGRISLIGGVFAEDFQFEGDSLGTLVLPANPFQATLGSDVNVESEGGYQGGFRAGVAYEIPEIAFRAQVLYRSEVEHDAVSGTGTVAFGQVDPILQAAIPALAAISGQTVSVESSLNTVTSPQSISVDVQTGIAEDTLLTGSFRWTDWSTNEAVVVSISNPAAGISSSTYQPYYWDDGYTGTIGIGRAFTDTFSGGLQIGYDSGVSTGAETTYTDFYRLSGGVSFSGTEFGEIRFGGLVGYLTEGEQRVSDGAYFDAEVGGDLVLGASASLAITF